MILPVLAIDPGTTESAYVLWDGKSVVSKGFLPNAVLLENLGAFPSSVELHIEMVACYGMAVGKETFETVFWIGRFAERWQMQRKKEAHRVFRQPIKVHHCHSVRASDSNIRQALIDKYGAPGTKNNPGTTYGISKHLWAAFALATYVTESAALKPDDHQTGVLVRVEELR